MQEEIKRPPKISTPKYIKIEKEFKEKEESDQKEKFNLAMDRIRNSKSIPASKEATPYSKV